MTVLVLGSQGAEVGNWQRFLNAEGHRDAEGKWLTVDEQFGPRTEQATRSFQEACSLEPSGTVEAFTRTAGLRAGFIPFVQAAHYSAMWPKRYRSPQLIVIHTMECHETPEAAENVALWFAGKTKYPAPKASAHYCIDTNSVVQCVRDVDIAWHANEVNPVSLGIEHAGYAKQSTVEWGDSTSRLILWKSAQLVAKLCKHHAIPIDRVTPEGIRHGARGLCGHVDVTSAYPRAGGHYDPGPHFPWDDYLGLIKIAM